MPSSAGRLDVLHDRSVTRSYTRRGARPGEDARRQARCTAAGSTMLAGSWHRAEEPTVTHHPRPVDHVEHDAGDVVAAAGHEGATG